MLSPRVWAEQFPRQLRLFAAFLAALAFVAPTWHVCSMSGHMMTMTHAPGDSSGAMNHNGEPFAKSQSGALICFCAPHEKLASARGFAVNGRSAMTHDATCLALLLSAMPAQLSAPPRVVSASFISFPIRFAARRDFPTRQLVRTFSSRGPPV